MYQFPEEPKVLLSEELQRYVEELDWDFYEEFLQPEEREEFKEAEKRHRDFTELLVRSKKVLSDIGAEPIESFIGENRNLIELRLDQYYTLQRLEEVASIVRRTLQLSTLSARNVPNWRTNRFIAEATEAYIQGLPLATVAICRAALELALKERLGYEGGEASYTSLRDHIQEAAKWNILSRVKAAKDLVEECNKVLHQGEVTDEQSSLKILAGVRALIEEVYSADGRF